MSLQNLRVVTWNINCGVFTELEESEDGSSQDGTSYIIQCLNKLKPDIVALQEVSFSNSTKDKSLSEILRENVGFKDSKDWPISPSHIIKDAKLGLSILSNYQITEEKPISLPKYNFKRVMPDGETWKLHDKGILGTRIQLNEEPICFLCGHLPPFKLFNHHPSESRFKKLWDKVSDTLQNSLDLPVICCMDFNAEEIKEYMPTLFLEDRFNKLVHQVTRPGGQKHDQILASNRWKTIMVRVIPTRFDHHICCADLQLKPESEEKKKFYFSETSKKTSFIHLSDLHFGKGSKEDVEWKTFIAHAERKKRLDRFAEFLKYMPNVPDYLIISGDITIAGNEDGFKEFVEIFDTLIKQDLLPGAERIIIVPGNHDLLRTPATEKEYHKIRWSTFYSHFENRFIRPWFPDLDSDLETLVGKLKETLGPGIKCLGGISRGIDSKLGTSKDFVFPFIFDFKKSVFIYAFNSASISGSQYEISDDLRDSIKFLKTSDMRNKEEVLNVISSFEKRLWVDPARIDPREIDLFYSVINILIESFPDEFANFLKIAVLHHHVTPIYREEVKEFELLLNAGQFKHALKDAQFDLILHGHKHFPEVLIDTAIPDDGHIAIISGGTIGGGEATGKQPGFHWIEWQIPESAIITSYIELKESGFPKKIIDDGMSQTRSLPIKEKEQTFITSNILNLRSLYAQTEKSLNDNYHEQNIGINHNLCGWSHMIEEDRVSVIATAYGLNILSIVGVHLYDLKIRLNGILDSIQSMRHEDGGWSGSSQRKIGRPEATAFVLSSLSNWNRDSEINDGLQVLLRMIENENDPIFWETIYSLSTVARVLSRINSNSDILSVICNTIKNAAFHNERGEMTCWGPKTIKNMDEKFGYSDTKGSTIHTAHAIIALLYANKSSKGLGANKEELVAARDWLLEQNTWENITEDINRQIDHKEYDNLVVKHFTSPWVVIALLELGVSPENTRLTKEIKKIATTHENGLWNWGSVARPIWATHDAIFALKEYAFSGVRY